MAGDISRSTFRKTKHYSGVRLQQGRVQLDADFNEQIDIGHHLTRTACLDLIGPAGAPVADAGFSISVKDGQLLIGPGRMYVNGILCENDTTMVWATNPVYYTPYLPLLMTHYILPFHLGGFNTQATAPQLKAGMYSVYLDVWERPITALDDPDIREIALGGPDTATRTKVVWQVQTLRLGDPGTAQTCSQNWAALLPDSTATLTAQAQPDPTAATPCSIQAQAGYRSLENQLYRVQIHMAPTGGTPTFKWSRDNASVAALWTGVDPANSNNLQVSTLGPDQALGFAAGQWIELIDDSTELVGKSGTLVQLTGARVIGQSPTLTIDPTTASGPINFLSFPANPKIRRWDHTATAAAPLSGGAVPVVEGTPIALENGVQVTFTHGGTYKPGDFWTIPARTATAISAPAVQWPADGSGNAVAQPPQGIKHNYASLALLSVDAKGNMSIMDDCRLVFSPQAHTPSFHVIRVSANAMFQSEFTNDRLVNFGMLTNGIFIVCDAPVDPNTISPATCEVTVDVPMVNTGADNLGFYPAAMRAVLTGNAVAQSTGGVNRIVWTPTAECLGWLSAQFTPFFKATGNKGMAMLRLTLRGAYISQLGVPSSRLDGYTRGNIANVNGATSLPSVLPSGNGGPGSDFETWFWLASDARPNYAHYGSGFQGIGGELL